MIFFKFKPFYAPKKFEWKDPDSGREFEARTREDLVKTIIAYRAQNGYPPIEALNIVLEHYWCNKPYNLGSCVPNPNIKRSFMGYLKGGIALLQNMLYNKMVSQTEADARSAICVECPCNVFPDKGYFMSWSDEIAEKSTGGLKSINHSKLGSCEACSCTLKAKVFYGGKFSHTEEELSKMPDFCWVKKEVLKDRGN